MRGSILLSMREYQLEHTMEISALMTAPPEARTNVMVDVAKRVRKRLARVLVKPEQAPVLDQALNAVVEAYKRSFAQC